MNQFKKKLMQGGSLLLALILLLSGRGPLLAEEISGIPEENILEAYKINMEAIAKIILEEGILVDMTEEELLVGAMKGMMSILDDPYSYYLTNGEFEDYWGKVSDENVGIGIRVEETFDGRMKVAEVFQDTPADRVGIRTGDIIHKINNVIVNYDEGIVALSAAKKATIAIIRDGILQPKVVTVEREEIESNTVTYEMKDDNIGYLKIRYIAAETPDEVAEALKALRQEGMEKLILDLRDNIGGYLDAVNQLAKFFIPEGTFVTTKSKNQAPTQYTVLNSLYGGEETVVLVNHRTASAAELLAGAIRDYGTGTLMGSTTLGKGIGQSHFFLPMTGYLKLTNFTYHLPLGENIHGIGLTPEIISEEGTVLYEEELSDMLPIMMAEDFDSSKVKHVLALQQALIFADYKVKITGTLDTQTKTAMKAVQRDYGLSTTAKYDNYFYYALMDAFDDKLSEDFSTEKAIEYLQ